MIHRIIEGDVMEGLATLPDRSVHCCITSPPYWSLRDYGVGGQIGLEPSPGEYVSKMVEVFREVRRVLRDDGTLWLNLGDCYSHNISGGGSVFENGRTGERTSYKSDEPRGRERLSTLSNGLKPKDLIGIPWRVAFALQADGWYLRSDIIWQKPNPMPSSVEDRPTTSHEYIFLLSKNARYYYDGEAIREPCSDSYKNDKRPVGVLRQRVNKNSKYPNEGQFKKQDYSGNSTYTGFNERWKNRGKGQKPSFNNSIQNGQNSLELTRNKRDVWTITTQARPEAHFASFPDEIPRICISAGTSEYGCCPTCGAPWKRIIEVSGGTTGKSWHPHENDAETGQIGGMSMEGYKREMRGWEPGCSCGEQPIPCTVLDPFGGSGTVAVVARELQRSSILIELNPAYIEIIRKRMRAGEQLDTGNSKIEFAKAVTA